LVVPGGLDQQPSGVGVAGFCGGDGTPEDAGGNEHGEDQPLPKLVKSSQRE
jgi:hypothetical protein